MLIQSQQRRVLPAASVKLGLGLTILNAILWLVAMILQVRQSLGPIKLPFLFNPTLQHFPSRPFCLIISITTLRRRPTYSLVSALAGPPQYCLLRLARYTV